MTTIVSDRASTTKVDRVVELAGFELHQRNEEELRLIYSEVFEDQEYRFDSPTASPRILDCGSHIGLSVLYFKRLYPRARIVAFEADPVNAGLLRANLVANAVTGVEVVAAAVSDVAGTAHLYDCAGEGAVWTWGSSIIHDMWGDAGQKTAIEVPAVHLEPYLDEPVDLLKLDIEGAEQRVLESLGDGLSQVDQLIFEFHPSLAGPGVNELDRITDLLHDHGFVLDFPPKRAKRSRHRNRLVRARRGERS